MVELSIWRSVRVHTTISFFQIFRAFLTQETLNGLLLVFSGILFIHLFLNVFFRNTGEMRKVATLSTTPSHCKLIKQYSFFLSRRNYQLIVAHGIRWKLWHRKLTKTHLIQWFIFYKLAGLQKSFHIQVLSIWESKKIYWWTIMADSV